VADRGFISSDLELLTRKPGHSVECFRNPAIAANILPIFRKVVLLVLSFRNQAISEECHRQVFRKLPVAMAFCC